MNSILTEFYNQLPEAEEGTFAYVKNQKKAYIMNNKTWVPMEIKNESNISIYEINKQIYEQLDPPNNRKLKGMIKQCQKEMDSLKKEHFYLLYGKEMSYFTILERSQSNNIQKTNLIETAAEVLESIGAVIYDMSYLSDQEQVEIWVKYNGEIYCLYLCGWDLGMVEFYG